MPCIITNKGRIVIAFAVREKLLEMKDVLGIPEFGGPWFCTTLRPGEVTVNMTRTAGNAVDNRILPQPNVVCGKMYSK